MEKKSRDRFKEYTLQEGQLKKVIIKDTAGVTYLFVSDGKVGGITPLLDINGKPIQV